VRATFAEDWGQLYKWSLFFIRSLYAPLQGQTDSIPNSSEGFRNESECVQKKAIKCRHKGPVVRVTRFSQSEEFAGSREPQR
jgi:hypothetical protein